MPRTPCPYPPPHSYRPRSFPESPPWRREYQQPHSLSKKAAKLCLQGSRACTPAGPPPLLVSLWPMVLGLPGVA